MITYSDFAMYMKEITQKPFMDDHLQLKGQNVVMIKP